MVLKSLPGGLPDHALLLAVGVAGHHQDAHGHPGTKNSNNITIPNNLCPYNFGLRSLPGGVPDQALLLAIGVAGHHPDGHGRLETS